MSEIPLTKVCVFVAKRSLSPNTIWARMEDLPVHDARFDIARRSSLFMNKTG